MYSLYVIISASCVCVCCVRVCLAYSKRIGFGSVVDDIAMIGPVVFHLTTTFTVILTPQGYFPHPSARVSQAVLL